MLLALRLLDSFERVSGEESDERGDSLGARRFPPEGDSEWCCSGVAGEAGSGVLRGVGEVRWSSSVSEASRSIMEKSSSILLLDFSGGTSKARERKRGESERGESEGGKGRGERDGRGRGEESDSHSPPRYLTVTLCPSSVEASMLPSKETREFS